MNRNFYSLFLALMAFSLTDMVYAANCLTAKDMHSGLTGTNFSMEYYPSQVEKRVAESFPIQFGKIPGLSVTKKEFMLRLLVSLFDEKSDFRFKDGFDDLIKKINDNTPVSVQEHKIDDKTSICHYYAKIDGSDILLLSFRQQNTRE